LPDAATPRAATGISRRGVLPLIPTVDSDGTDITYF